MYNFNNKTIYLRTEKDSTYPFHRISYSILNNSNLDYCEKSIMCELLAHSNDYIVNKGLIRQVLRMPHAKFQKAWKLLEDKHFIDKERFKGGVKWVINEAGNFNFTKVLENNTLNNSISLSGVELLTNEKNTIDTLDSRLKTKEGLDEKTPRTDSRLILSNGFDFELPEPSLDLIDDIDLDR